VCYDFHSHLTSKEQNIHAFNNNNNNNNNNNSNNNNIIMIIIIITIIIIIITIIIIIITYLSRITASSAVNACRSCC